MNARPLNTDHDNRKRPIRPIVAVGAVVLNEDGEVLLIRRAKPPRAGEWSLPGGAIELGETVHSAVVREVREETNLTVSVLELLMNVDSIIKDDDGLIDYHYVLLDYLAVTTGGTLKAGDDASDAGFFTLQDACKMVSWDETRNLLGKAAEIWKQKS